MMFTKEGSMHSHAVALACGIALSAVSGLAQAGVVQGPAGRLTLPDDIVASVAPANPAHPNLATSVEITLTGERVDAGRPVTLTLSCGPAIGRLDSAKGMEILASVTIEQDKTLKRAKGGGWITLDAFQTYRSEAARADGSRLTQWLVPLVVSFAWIKFDRPEGSPVEQDVLDAIAGMKVLCGPTANRGAE